MVIEPATMTAKDLQQLLSAVFECEVVAVQDQRDVVCPLSLMLNDPARFATGSHLVIATGDNATATTAATTGRADEREAARYWLATRDPDDEDDDEEDEDEDEDDDEEDDYEDDDDEGVDPFFEFEGGPVTIAEARDAMGIEDFSPAFIVDFLIEQRDGNEEQQATWLISEYQFESALAQLSGARSASSTSKSRALSGYIMTSIFSLFDDMSMGYCDLRELGCGLMLFCGGEIIDRAQMAYNLVAEADDEEDENTGRYPYEKDGVTREMMVTAIASLLKVVGVLNSAYLNSCDPVETAEDITDRAFRRAKVWVVA
jgi:hypothetical protein